MMQAERRAETRKPWAQWPCEERGAELPISLLANGILAMLVSRCDQQTGRILRAGLSPTEILVRRFFVPKTQRRSIAPLLDELVAAGRIQIVDDAIVVLAVGQYFEKRQRTDSKRVRDDSKSFEMIRTDLEMNREIAKPTESFKTTLTDIDLDLEEDKELDLPPLPPATGGVASAGRDAFWILAKGYKARYEHYAKDAWMQVAANEREIWQVAAYVDAQPDPKRAASELLDGFFADEWSKANRWPWKRLAKDPARFRGSTKEAARDEGKAEYAKAADRLFAAVRRGAGDEEITRLEKQRDELYARNYGKRTDSRASANHGSANAQRPSRIAS